MQIRREQLAVFEEQALQRWKAEMAAHVNWFAPELAAVAGADNVSQFVGESLELSARYGFADRGPARLLLEMQLSFGCGFDTDPLLPWALAALKTPGDQHQRASRLHSASVDYLRFTAGPNDGFTVAALRRAARLTEADLHRVAGNLEDRIAAMLKAAYPEKYSYCGASAVDSLVTAAAGEARRYGITGEAGVATVTGALFAFGHKAATDPLYPWIGRSLREPGGSEALHRRMNVYFERSAAVLEQAQ